MATENETALIGGLQINVGLDFHKVIDYDRRAMRQVLVKGAAEVRKSARRMVARNAISAAGEFPGADTGTLKRAIGIIARGSKGGWVKVGVKKTPAMQDYYPAFLFYGSRKRNLKARKNYITAALEERSSAIRASVQAALKQSLVPR